MSAHEVVVLRLAPDGTPLGIECSCGLWGAGGYHVDLAIRHDLHLAEVFERAAGCAGQGVLF